MSVLELASGDWLSMSYRQSTIPSTYGPEPPLEGLLHTHKLRTNGDGNETEGQRQIEGWLVGATCKLLSSASVDP